MTQYTGGGGCVIRGMSFADERQGVAVGECGDTSRSFWIRTSDGDGGRTWYRQTADVNPSQVLYGVAFADAENGIIVGDGGLILRTYSGGDDPAGGAEPQPQTMTARLALSRVGGAPVGRRVAKLGWAYVPKPRVQTFLVVEEVSMYRNRSRRATSSLSKSSPSSVLRRANQLSIGARNQSSQDVRM